MKNIILASQSPRRRELLTQIGLEFEVHPAGGEEIITSTDPVEVVKSLSTQKAAAVKEELEPQLPENWLVIGADTIVVYDGKILGKPKDEADAIRMLRMLQGQTHSVYTGVTLLEEGKQTTFAEETKVSMYPMTEEEIAKRMEELSYLKVQLRDQEENKLVLLRAERMYEESLGKQRERLEAGIRLFEDALRSEDRKKVEESRKTLYELMEDD